MQFILSCLEASFKPSNLFNCWQTSIWKAYAVSRQLIRDHLAMEMNEAHKALKANCFPITSEVSLF